MFFYLVIILLFISAFEGLENNCPKIGMRPFITKDGSEIKVCAALYGDNMCHAFLKYVILSL